MSKVVIVYWIGNSGSEAAGCAEQSEIELSFSTYGEFDTSVTDEFETAAFSCS